MVSEEVAGTLAEHPECSAIADQGWRFVHQGKIRRIEGERMTIPEHFRKMGVVVEDSKELNRADYIRISRCLFYAVLFGSVLWGLLIGAAWVLRTLGVRITGV
jgi:hypothetical protein